MKTTQSKLNANFAVVRQLEILIGAGELEEWFLYPQRGQTHVRVVVPALFHEPRHAVEERVGWPAVGDRRPVVVAADDFSHFLEGGVGWNDVVVWHWWVKGFLSFWKVFEGFRTYLCILRRFRSSSFVGRLPSRAGRWRRCQRGAKLRSIPCWYCGGNWQF